MLCRTKPALVIIASTLYRQRGLVAEQHVWFCSACHCDRESFKNTPRGGHAAVDGDAAARTAEEAAKQMREGKGSGILGGSGVA